MQAAVCNQDFVCGSAKACFSVVTVHVTGVWANIARRKTAFQKVYVGKQTCHAGVHYDTPDGLATTPGPPKAPRPILLPRSNIAHPPMKRKTTYPTAPGQQGKRSWEGCGRSGRGQDGGLDDKTTARPAEEPCGRVPWSGRVGPSSDYGLPYPRSLAARVVVAGAPLPL